MLEIAGRHYGGADVDVAGFILTVSTDANSSASAVATVLVLNRLCEPVLGASIVIQWSGLVSGSSAGTTDGNGYVVLTSGSTKQPGEITGTINTINGPSGVYQGNLFPETLTRTVATK